MEHRQEVLCAGRENPGFKCAQSGRNPAGAEAASHQRAVSSRRQEPVGSDKVKITAKSVDKYLSAGFVFPYRKLHPKDTCKSGDRIKVALQFGNNQKTVGKHEKM